MVLQLPSPALLRLLRRAKANTLLSQDVRKLPIWYETVAFNAPPLSMSPIPLKNYNFFPLKAIKSQKSYECLQDIAQKNIYTNMANTNMKNSRRNMTAFDKSYEAKRKALKQQNFTEMEMADLKSFDILYMQIKFCLAVSNFNQAYDTLEWLYAPI